MPMPNGRPRVATEGFGANAWPRMRRADQSRARVPTVCRAAQRREPQSGYSDVVKLQRALKLGALEGHAVGPARPELCLSKATLPLPSGTHPA
jgi:hypothetical protein